MYECLWRDESTDEAALCYIRSRINGHKVYCHKYGAEKMDCSNYHAYSNSDFNDTVEVLLEKELYKNKQLRPILELLAKYGICGLRAADFLIEFASACNNAQ